MDKVYLVYESYWDAQGQAFDRDLYKAVGSMQYAQKVIDELFNEWAEQLFDMEPDTLLRMSAKPQMRQIWEQSEDLEKWTLRWEGWIETAEVETE